jgi:hypothetical protein
MLGNGNGFKFGPGGNNTLRRCISYNNKKPATAAGGRGFTSNGGAGSLIEFCTSYRNDEYEFLNSGGFSNTYRNNIAVGSPNAMKGSIETYNSWNLVIIDPGFISTDPASADYLSLKSNSSCIDAASNGTDLGALQYGERMINLISGELSVVQPLVLNAIGNKSVNEGQLITFTISATGSDVEALSYSASNLPSGATFNTQTKTFSWKPLYNQAGIYSVNFTVSGGEQTDSEMITITVIQLYEDWDVNGDDATNTLDLILVGQSFGQVGLNGWIQADVNEDGNISVLDIIIIVQHFD